MKKFVVLILGIIVLGIILYLTFVIAVLKAAIGIVLLLVAAGLLWWIWHTIKEKLD